KLVFFFDEAHLLFDEAPKALVDKVEQVVRLIRSKGVGVYFVTQNPIDVPETVAGQLGSRVQHALRAYTPRDQKAVRAAAETFRPNPQLNTAQVISELGVGEALVSTLEGKGAPTIVQRTLIAPPTARIGPVTPAERQAILKSSAMAGRYDLTIDRDSAYEMLARKAQNTVAADQAAQQADAGGIGGVFKSIFGSGSGRGAGLNPGQRVAREVTRTIVNQTVGGVAASIGRSVAGSIGGSVARSVVRGVLGSLLRR
ncbi:MAG: helicase HerA-like domain-containing protein, partial [Hansschlegelia sp.]